MAVITMTGTNLAAYDGVSLPVSLGAFMQDYNFLSSPAAGNDS